MSGIFVAGYGFAFADILRDEKAVVKAEIQSPLSKPKARQSHTPINLMKWNTLHLKFRKVSEPE